MAPNLFLAAAAGTLTAQVVTVIIAFFLVMWVLKAFAWSPVLQVIDERKNSIIKEFETIEARQAQLDSQIADYQQRLANIDQEARQRINEAVEDGKKISAEIIEEARKASEQMKAKATSDIQMEMEKARVELRDEMVRLTIQATEKLLHQELDDQKHREMVNNFIVELQQRKAS